MGKVFMLSFFLSVATAALVYYLTVDGGIDPALIKGKRVLVTGTSSGIGEELAYTYSRLGARILITARRQHLLEKVARKCQELGAEQVVYVAADMSTAADRQKVMAAAEKHFDGGLDYLILNHVLVSHGRWKSSPENITQLRTTYEVNFFSYVEMASMATPMLVKAGGKVGVISSVTGKVPMAGFAYYSSAKHALDGFFSSWRNEMEKEESGVTVTTCVLGLIATDAALDSVRQGIVKTPVYLAASVLETAEAIVGSVSRGDRELYFPWAAKLAVVAHKFFPFLIQRVSADMTY